MLALKKACAKDVLYFAESTMLETIPVLMKMFSATSSIALDARLFLQSSIACTPYFSRGSVQHAASATPACSSSVSS